VSSVRELVQRVIGDRSIVPIAGACIGLVLGLAIAAVVLTGGSL
jgi:hypothetical protein